MSWTVDVPLMLIDSRPLIRMFVASPRPIICSKVRGSRMGTVKFNMFPPRAASAVRRRRPCPHVSLMAMVTQVRNHPFVEGNKRTGMMAAYVFLRINGYRLEASEAEAVVVFQDLAAGEIDEAVLAKWIEANAAPV